MFVAHHPMNADKPSERLVADDEKRLVLEAAKRKLAARLGVDPDLLGRKISFGLDSVFSPEQELELAKAKGLQIGLDSMDELLPRIRTREDLDRVAQMFGVAEHQAPSKARIVIDHIKRKLPRRGGPGRTPKLDTQESIIVCKEILKQIGKGNTLTKALKEVSKMCPDILQKKVSPRTLSKVWNRRKEFSLD
jgi:hypothetical protein